MIIEIFPHNKKDLSTTLAEKIKFKNASTIQLYLCNLPVLSKFRAN